MRHSFCGSIDDPKSTAHTVIIHEAGHMLANQPRVHFNRQYSALIDDYNAKVAQYNQHNDPTLADQLNTMNEKLQRMQQNRIQSPGTHHRGIFGAQNLSRRTDGIRQQFR